MVYRILAAIIAQLTRIGVQHSAIVLDRNEHLPPRVNAFSTELSMEVEQAWMESMGCNLRIYRLFHQSGAQNLPGGIIDLWRPISALLFPDFIIAHFHPWNFIAHFQPRDFIAHFQTRDLIALLYIFTSSSTPEPFSEARAPPMANPDHARHFQPKKVCLET
jgi:hypothetical protein